MLGWELNLTQGAKSAVFAVEGSSLRAVAIASYLGKMHLSELIVLASADSLGEIIEIISLNR